MKARAMLLVPAALSALVVTAQQQPPSINELQGARIVRQVKGDGVQIYTCGQTAKGIQWMLPSKPDAKLVDDSGKPVGTHFAGPTWKFGDGGQVQGENPKPLPHPKPDAGSIPWLFIEAKTGTATGSLEAVTYITRTETHGGVAPASGCTSAQDVDKTVQVPYTATYTFYGKK